MACAAGEAERVRQATQAESARQAVEAEAAAADSERTRQAAAAELERARQTAKREAMIREHGLASIVGQEETVKRLQAFASLFSGTGDAARGHILLTGPAGTGKRTIARAFAAEYCQHLTEGIGATLVRTGDLMGLLTSLADGDGLLIAGIDRISKVCAEFLIGAVREHKVYFTLDKGMFAKTVDVPLKRFTLMATTESPSISPELMECFHLTVSLAPRYSDDALATICERTAREAGLVLAPDAAGLVAGAAHGSPHQVKLLVRKLAGLGKAEIEGEDAAQLLSVLGMGPKPRAQGELATEELDALSGIEFERLVTGLLDAMGFRTAMTKASGDGGIDIVAVSDRLITGGKYLFQCKRYAPGNLVGSPTVREFYGAVRADPEAVKGILITTSGFTQQALEFARQLPIELIAGDKLRELLAEYRLTQPCPPLQ